MSEPASVTQSEYFLRSSAEAPPEPEPPPSPELPEPAGAARAAEAEPAELAEQLVERLRAGGRLDRLVLVEVEQREVER